VPEKSIEPPKNVFYDNITGIECKNDEKKETDWFTRHFTSCKLANAKPTISTPPIIEIDDLQEVIVDGDISTQFFHSQAYISFRLYNNKTFRCNVGQGMLGKKLDCWIPKPVKQEGEKTD